MIKYLLPITSILLFNYSNCQSLTWETVGNLPAAPDYSLLSHWAAHPDKTDPADLLAGKPGQLERSEAARQVDVFFIYPTIYLGETYPDHPWFADVNDEKLNSRIDDGTIKFQASVFNETARVFAPRYRQAHLSVFSEKDQKLKDSVLRTAFQDVKEAFKYYLENENKGRPFIIASHSQGTVHAAYLIKDTIENTPLRDLLIAAYIIGMPLKKDLFENLKPCENADETGCWITWNTFARKYYPEHFNQIYDNALSTNPLNWTIDDTYAHRDENLGGLLREFDKIRPRLTDAQNYQGILWIKKPYFPGRIFLKMKRFHVADYNFFYMNIRENVARRTKNYLRENPRI